MRITYMPDGRALPIYEPGDFVRLVRDEPGDLATAFAGDWGEVVRNRGAQGIDVRLAGYCRPRSSDLPMVTGLPSYILVPCDRSGLRIEFQRDLRRARG